jgi:hypothetical protein
MKRSHIITMVAALSALACTDNPNSGLTGPTDPMQPNFPTPSMTTIAGRISVTGLDGDRLIELRDEFGNVYRLVGSEALALASVDGGDVVARGTFDANPGFVVDEFEVTAMYGRPALDGVLETTDEGFALRFTDGSLRVVPGLSAECAEHIGARVWVTGWEDDSEAIQLGVIAAV